MVQGHCGFEKQPASICLSNILQVIQTPKVLLLAENCRVLGYIHTDEFTHSA